MKRNLALVAVLVLALIPRPGTCSWLIGANAGVGIPTGSFSDYFKSGLLIGGSVGYVSTPFEIGADASWQKNNPSDDYQAALDLASADGEAQFLQYGVHANWMPSTSGSVSPYLGVGLGLYHLKDKYEDPSGTADITDTPIGVHGAAGLNYWVGRTWGLGADVSYHAAFVDEDKFPYDTASYFAIQGGLRFKLTPSSSQ
jgi:Outer membrane protein beta-barrel domain